MELYGDFEVSVRRALAEIDPGWERLRGLVICGSHTPKVEEVDFLLGKIREARERKIPCLGICYGYQLAAVEFARNVLGIRDATSEEFGKGTFVVKKRKELNVGHKEGESYWNNYEVSIPVVFPSHFVVSQFHPEYESWLGHFHPLLVKFLKLCNG